MLFQQGIKIKYFWKLKKLSKNLKKIFKKNIKINKKK